LRRKKSGFPRFFIPNANATELVAAAAAVTAATTFAMFVVMVVAVATAATVVIVVVVMIVTMRTVNVTMLQLFRRCFANRDNFNVELQILASQHVVTVNHVFVFHFGDFYRYRTLIGFRQEAHANLQFINAHKYVFRNALNQVFVVLTVRR
jgi:hypothetical protein